MDDSADREDVYEHIRQGQEFIRQTHAKMSKLVEEFAQGKINRAQFHQLYDRYQRQITGVAELIAESDPATWREALQAGEGAGDDTFHIRQRLTAKAIGMAVYDNESGMPIETLGDFQVDPALIVPLLSSYQSAAAEIFRAGMRSSAMANGRWLSFVPGRYTSLIALFSLEPSGDQLDTIERMHRDFEAANRAALEKGNADPEKLAYPFLSFIRRVRRTD